MFGSLVVGVSLFSPITMHIRRKLAEGYESSSQVLAPRSVHALGGSSRIRWQHMIRAAKGFRYSVTLCAARARSKTA